MNEAANSSLLRTAANPNEPNPARVYDALLGGKDNYAADRAVADKLAEAKPALRPNVRANRAYLGRVTRFLATQAGIRQFLDLGTGLPSLDNTHEVAQRAARDSRIVYVDNDPMVTAHARALLTSTPEGQTWYIEDDLRNPGEILAAAEILDLTRPVGLILVAVVHFLPSQPESASIVRTLLEALPAGSHLVMSCATTDFLTPELAANWDESLRTGRSDVYPRTRAEFDEFFTGLEVVAPGVVAVSEWRPDPQAAETATPVEASIFGAVGRV